MNRRQMLTASLGAALLGFAMTAAPAVAVEPSKITPQLVEAAKKEGKVVFYTSVEVRVAEKIAKDFEAKFPGVSVQVERSGSERIFQRLGQENMSKIYAADVVSTSDAAHFVIWEREGILAQHVPEDVALHFPAEQRDPNGTYASWRVSLSPMGYNTKLVKAEEAPKGYRDLLDPKWAGKLVKASPSYSGTALTATYQIARDLGWEYLEKLSKQRVMQVQSSTEPPKKLSLGERAVMVDGNEYVLLALKEAGNPVDFIYPVEGTPLIISPSAILKTAPHPNAARLFQNYLFTREAQQLLIDEGGLRSFHDQTKDRADLPAFKDIKVMKEDAKAVADQAESIKKRHSRYFGT